MHTNHATAARVGTSNPLAFHRDAQAAGGGPELLAAVARQDRDSVARLLREQPDSVRFRDSRGNTALHLAIVLGCDLAIVDLLLAHRADPAVLNADGNSCMHLAFALRPPVPALPDRMMAVRWYGDGRGFGAIGASNRDGRNALQLANDADGTVAPGYENAVATAVREVLKWRDAVARMLINAVDAHDAVAVRELVTRTGWRLEAPVGVLDNLLVHSLRLRAFPVALEVIRMAVEHRTTGVLSDSGKDGMATPLALAAIEGRADVMRALLEGGADVHRVNMEGQCALHVAAVGSAECVRLLLDHGAEPDVQTTYQRLTPMMLAAIKGKEDSIRALHGAGANVNAADSQGRTPLMHAYLGGHPELDRLLVSLGANRDARDSLGVSAREYKQKIKEYEWQARRESERAARHARRWQGQPPRLGRNERPDKFQQSDECAIL